MMDVTLMGSLEEILKVRSTARKYFPYFYPKKRRDQYDVDGIAIDTEGASSDEYG